MIFGNEPKILRLRRRVEFNCGHSEDVLVTWYDDADIEARWRELAARYSCELCRQTKFELDIWGGLTAAGLAHLEHVASLYDTARTKPA